MSLKFVMLGFLSQSPMTGYDLKKQFSMSDIFHWSGNNNQIYKSLVELHEAGWVTIEVHYQQSKPPRKVYSITEAGLAALRDWVVSPPEMPQFRSGLLMQLAWADAVEPTALNTMITTYAEELDIQILTLREQARRKWQQGAESLSRQISEHWISFYEHERDWVRIVQHQLNTR